MKQIAQKSATQAKSSIALPKKEGDILSNVIKKAWDKYQIPLLIKSTGYNDISKQFFVVLEIAPKALPMGPNKMKLKQNMTRKVGDLFGATPAWQKGSGLDLKYMTANTFPILGVKGQTKQKYWQFCGVATEPSDPALKAILKAGANLNFNGQNKSKATSIIEAVKKVDSSMAQKLSPKEGDLPLGHIFKPKEALIKSIVLELESTDASDTTAIKKIIHRFWTILKELGDPIAQLAINLNKGEGLSANSAAILLRHHLGDKYFREYPPTKEEYVIIQDKGLQDFKAPSINWLLKQNSQVETWFRKIQKKIALNHWLFAQGDEKSLIITLDSKQITNYHHDILREMGLPKTAFGGTPLGGNADNWFNKKLAKYLWCKDCIIVEKYED